MRTAAWLTLSPASGSGTGTLAASVNTAGLATGTYNTTITVAASGAASQSVSRGLDGGGRSRHRRQPGCALLYRPRRAAPIPHPQTVTISNTGGTLSWSASDTAAWLTLSPASGSGTGTLAASVNTAGLATGTYNTTITVAALRRRIAIGRRGLDGGGRSRHRRQPGRALLYRHQQGGANPAASDRDHQ